MQPKHFKLNKITLFTLPVLSLLSSAVMAQEQANAPVTRFIVEYGSTAPQSLRTPDQLLSSAALKEKTQFLQQHVAQDLSALAGAPLSYVRASSAVKGRHIVKADRKLSEKETEEMRKNLAKDPSVSLVVEDKLLTRAATPNDTQYTSQWHYYESTGGLRANTAWDNATGTGVVVAVLDTGYRPHADLNANILPGYDMISDSFVGNDGNGRDTNAQDPGDWILANECGGTHAAQDSSWHGTHVAGTVAAVTNNASGVAGVAYGAKVVPVRVLGKCGGYTSDIADGIIWASGGTV